ncbi:hypothetical protein MHYP_G00267480 [Metynnis hypsauchen]
MLLPQRILCSSFLLGSSKLSPCQAARCPSQSHNNCRYSRHAGLEHDPTPWLTAELLLDGDQAWCLLLCPEEIRQVSMVGRPGTGTVELRRSPTGHTQAAVVERR